MAVAGVQQDWRQSTERKWWGHPGARDPRAVTTGPGSMPRFNDEVKHIKVVEKDSWVHITEAKKFESLSVRLSICLPVPLFPDPGPGQPTSPRQGDPSQHGQWDLRARSYPEARTYEPWSLCWAGGPVHSRKGPWVTVSPSPRPPFPCWSPVSDFGIN